MPGHRRSGKTLTIYRTNETEGKTPGVIGIQDRCDRTQTQGRETQGGAEKHRVTNNPTLL